MSRTHKYIGVALVILLFVFLRFYKLPSSLEFFGDVGRDLHELTLMIEEKKPTLLGPGISFLPLNQSPIYYYTLLPIFIMTGRSPFSTQITFSLLYIMAFLVGVYITNKNQSKLKLTFPATILGLLVATHPEFVHQMRNPWNPSFAPPFIFIALFTLIFLKQKFSYKKIIILCLSLALALSMTVSITPAVIVILGYASYLSKNNLKRIFKIWGIFFGSVFVTFLPVIIFEIRHNFFFIKRLMLDDPFLSKQSVSFWEKIIDLGQFLTGTYTSVWTLISVSAILTAIFINFFISKKSNFKQKLDQNFTIFLTLFIISTILTVLMPFVLHAHYIFGILALLFMTIVMMRKSILIALLLILGMVWLNPAQTNRYFTPPRRTVTQMTACMEKTCQQLSEPVFVTAQAWHEYHSALEYTYMLNRAGCPARNIIQHPDFASQMIVVADNNTYEHGLTNFEELSIFDPSTKTNELICDDNLRVYFLDSRQ